MESSLRPLPARTDSMQVDNSTIVEAEFHFPASRDTPSSVIAAPDTSPVAVNVSNGVTMSLDLMELAPSPTQPAVTPSSGNLLAMLSRARPDLPVAQALALVSKPQLSETLRNILRGAQQTASAVPVDTGGLEKKVDTGGLEKKHMLRAKTLPTHAPSAPPRPQEVSSLVASVAREPSASVVPPSAAPHRSTGTGATIQGLVSTDVLGPGRTPIKNVSSVAIEANPGEGNGSKVINVPQPISERAKVFVSSPREIISDSRSPSPSRSARFSPQTERDITFSPLPIHSPPASKSVLDQLGSVSFRTLFCIVSVPSILHVFDAILYAVEPVRLKVS